MMSKNRLKSKKITFYCEGKTEEFYLKSLLESFSNLPNPNRYEFRSKKQNSYKSWYSLLERSEQLSDTVIVVADLDRVQQNNQEFKHLEKLIRTLKKRKNKSHIFLTYLDFEDWLRHHFDPPIQKQKLPQKLRCKNLDELKTKENLYKSIQNNGGCIKNAESYFKNFPLFCDRDFNLSLNNINSLQSNLFYFRDYILKIHKE